MPTITNKHCNNENFTAMNRLLLIIQREYVTAVAKKSFIILTLLMPFIIIGVGAAPAVLMTLNDSNDVKKIAVVDNTGSLANTFKNSDGYEFVTISPADAPDIRAYYNNAGGELYAIVYVPADALSANSVTIFSENTVSMDLQHAVSRQINKTLTSVKMKQYQDKYQIDNLEKIIDDCDVEIITHNVKWGDEGKEETSLAEIGMMLGMVLSFAIYLFVLSYGAMVMNGVVEEKSNRIVEVIVSSCKPMELMLGKIIGVALVGLTQFAVWALMIGVASTVLGTAFIPSAAGDISTANQATEGIAEVWSALSSFNYFEIIVLFVLYFVGGYTMYAALFAAFGSAVDEPSDASQFTFPVIIIFIVAFYAGMACMENPDGQMAVWCSMIPFTSPLVMMVRLPYDVPFWQMALSVVLLYATALSFVWLAGRIFRRGILHYGKKSTWSQLLSWLK